MITRFLKPVSRRDVLRTSAATAAALSLAACARSQPPALLPHATPDKASDPPPLIGNAADVPPLEVLALNRMAYGPRPGDVQRVRDLGFAAYVEEQLAPDDNDDELFQERLRNARLHIEHEGSGDYPPTDEMRPLEALDQSAEQLWQLVSWEDEAEIPEAEVFRPAEEVVAATILRAAYSKWQLREVLVEFWHNHFHVNLFSDNERIAAMWPIYDRDVIRKHALGNFRQFLEAVSQSLPMLYYLDNASSRASPANENYARELFELHTLGEMHYLNAKYDNWRDVPGALDGLAEGYIDDDVYEAARAFTGWTVADGEEVEGEELLPNTGTFHYYAGWHDPYQKRVLGVEFDPNQPEMADGLRVLDLLAYHPGTARHVCTKLCRRLVADEPSESLVQQAVATWMKTQKAPDQIAQTVRTILLSSEFATTWGQKVKRPYELLISLARAIDADLRPSFELYDVMGMYGYQLFAWPAPDGHPDTATYWLSTNVMLGRWNIPLFLMSDWLEEVHVDLVGQLPSDVRTPRQIVEFWALRLLGRPLPDVDSAVLVAILRPEIGPDTPLEDTDFAEDAELIVRQLVSLIAMTPAFQWR